MEASTQARERQAAQNAKAKERVQELQEFVRRFSANKSKARQATSRAKQIEKIKIDEFKPSSRQYPWIRFDYCAVPGTMPFMQIHWIKKTALEVISSHLNTYAPLMIMRGMWVITLCMPFTKMRRH